MEKNEIKVHVKSKHLGGDERFIINKLLNDDYTPPAIAESLGVPVSTYPGIEVFLMFFRPKTYPTR